MNEGLLTGADSETITEAPPPPHTHGYQLMKTGNLEHTAQPTGI